ncbi:glycosyltransferase [candidate division KSB1 bacterium]|nr:glycosyltransferase [candidate division KSB1 bacterium]
MHLSIVIPVYNESKKIVYDIEAAAHFLEQANFEGEILVVDDGSTDDTAAIAAAVAAATAANVRIPSATKLRVLRNDQHHGKGFAVRAGIMQSHGEFVMFADSGLPVPYENALRGLRLLQNGGCELAHASRKLPESVIHRQQPWQRRLFSILFRWLAILFLKIPARLTDTQCGFKIYRGEIARELFEGGFTEGFMFDIEIILRAQQRGYRIQEFPIDWTCDPDSRLSVTRSPWHILRELIEIKRKIVDA